MLKIGKINLNQPHTPENVSRIFSNLIFQGKIGPAMKFLEQNADNAVLKPTVEVVEKLRELAISKKLVPKHFF